MLNGENAGHRVVGSSDRAVSAPLNIRTIIPTHALNETLELLPLI